MTLLTGFRNTPVQAEVTLDLPQTLWWAGTHTLHSITHVPSPDSRHGTEQAGGYAFECAQTGMTSSYKRVGKSALDLQQLFAIGIGHKRRLA